jgi:hypothetical protein
MKNQHFSQAQQPKPNPMTPGKEEPEPEIEPVPAKPETPGTPQIPAQPPVPNEVPEREIKRTPPNPQA